MNRTVVNPSHQANPTRGKQPLKVVVVACGLVGSDKGESDPEVALGKGQGFGRWASKVSCGAAPQHTRTGGFLDIRDV